MPSDQFPTNPEFLRESQKKSFLQSFETLPYNRTFDPKKASSEDWSDTSAWSRTEDNGTPVNVRMTSPYGEYVHPLDGTRPYYRLTAEGKRLTQEVGNFLNEIGFDVVGRDSIAKRYVNSFGDNLGHGLPPVEALSRAYTGEWCGTGNSENRAMWPDNWPKNQPKPQQWDIEDALGIKR